MFACKFGAYCLKSDCSFGHPSSAPVLGTVPMSTLRKFDPNCLNPACSFYHQSRTSTTCAVSGSLSILSDEKADPFNTPCKFDPYCTRKGCLFLHKDPSTSAPGPGYFKNRTLVKATSDRQFAVPDDQTERIEMDLSS